MANKDTIENAEEYEEISESEAMAIDGDSENGIETKRKYFKYPDMLRTVYRVI